MATVLLPPLQKTAEGNNEPVVQPTRKPKNPLASWGAQTMITSYSVDFCKKDYNPTMVRQCSATRRNRPHPSQHFMNWRLPSKPLLDGRSGYIVEPKSSEERYVLQNFYEEYKGEPTQKADLPTPPKMTEEDNQKLFQKLKMSGKPIATARLPLPSLNQEQLSLVTDLVTKATPQEQDILHNAFAFTESSDQPSYSFISPEAIKVLETLLKNVGITDNDTAIRFLLSVGQVIMSLSKATGQQSPRPKAPAERKARRLTPTSPDSQKHKHKDESCDMCNKSSLTNALRLISDKKDGALQLEPSSARSYLENIPRLPKLRAPKRHPPRTKTWHTIPSYPSQGKVENKLATFVLPHRPIPKCFTIHPEWS